MLTGIANSAVIGEESLVGATAFVKTDFSCPARSMVTENPVGFGVNSASTRRQLSDKEAIKRLPGKRAGRRNTEH